MDCSKYLDGLEVYAPPHDNWNCLEVDMLLGPMAIALEGRPFDEEVAKRFCTFANNLFDLQLTTLLRALFMRTNNKVVVHDYVNYYCNRYLDNFKKAMSKLTRRMLDLGIVKGNAIETMKKVLGV